MRIPSEIDLLEAYERLLGRKKNFSKVSADKLLCYGKWARFDARLAEIWVSYVSQTWESINPMLLRGPRDTYLGPLLEFAKILVAKNNPSRRNLFRSWCHLVMNGAEKAKEEQFFVGMRALGGVLMLGEAVESLPQYKKWGYLSQENLIPKLPSLSQSRRQELLERLLATTPRLRTVDYWRALGQGISLRQAERDLRTSPLIRRVGTTKGRYFIAR